MKAELVPDNGDPPIPVSRDVTVVGRREYCDIKIDHPSLSKRHCVLIKTDGLLLIRDLASTNGTKVKGQRIRWAALLPDDRIAFGGYKLRVYLGPDDTPGPSEIPRGAGVPSAPKRRPGAKPARPAPAVADLPVAEVDEPAPPAAVGFDRPSPVELPSVPQNGFWHEADSDDSGWRDQLRIDTGDDDGDVIIELD